MGPVPRFCSVALASIDSSLSNSTPEHPHLQRVRKAAKIPGRAFHPRRYGLDDRPDTRPFVANNLFELGKDDIPIHPCDSDAKEESKHPHRTRYSNLEKAAEASAVFPVRLKSMS